MKAYRNDPDVKAKFLDTLASSVLAKSNYLQMLKDIGVPLWLMRFREDVYENTLGLDLNKRFFEALEPGTSFEDLFCLIIDHLQKNLEEAAERNIKTDHNNDFLGTLLHIRGADRTVHTIVKNPYTLSFMVYDVAVLMNPDAPEDFWKELSEKIICEFLPKLKEGLQEKE